MVRQIVMNPLWIDRLQGSPSIQKHQKSPESGRIYVPSSGFEEGKRLNYSSRSRISILTERAAAAGHTEALIESGADVGFRSGSDAVRHT